MKKSTSENIDAENFLNSLEKKSKNYDELEKADCTLTEIVCGVSLVVILTYADSMFYAVVYFLIVLLVVFTFNKIFKSIRGRKNSNQM